MIPMKPDKNKSQHCDPDRQRHSTRIHGGVEEDDVKYDRAEDGQPEHWEQIKEKEQAANDLAEEDHIHVATCGDGGEELARRALRCWRSSHRNEVEEAVKAEDNKGKSKQNPDDRGDDFHARSLRPAGPKDKAKRRAQEDAVMVNPLPNVIPS